MAWTIDESSANSFRRDQLTPGCLVDQRDDASEGRQQTSSLFKSGKEHKEIIKSNGKGLKEHLQKQRLQVEKETQTCEPPSERSGQHQKEIAVQVSSHSSVAARVVPESHLTA